MSKAQRVKAYRTKIEFEEMTPKPSENYTIDYKDGNKKNGKIENLQWKQVN